ncbi:protein FAM163A-like [Anguilla rostrata]|uniref:protein FAM163A-like n=1 Tax=Anguilla anguilla TaxID=7936 RepID=UPI0015B15D86|nr:protein FAM163A-like [Anguilla anguilla]XP_035276432.1 protein FAM163A-like [Anguilla anguilla]XP_035276433.1 protein FAM163A-like [Anguilla anguilla]XP_035276434.1 protein FAM163A-like [Anguilla anguilla]XP_035276435.1 protein FAM163A-like [Anguilla anguilla]XP_035276436.1 protein FAM163A-like [Anguilla anguilla]XP_035276437.1 protein FAM163A-like [Anguilla anguilla]
MTAGTVVITGGILAAVILLFIIAVLCYCRLQYYCCKHNASEQDSCSYGDPQAQFACNACSAPGVDGAAVTPLCLPPNPAPPHSYCPTCSPYGNPFYIRAAGDVRNGGERLAYGPAHYENRALSLAMSAVRTPPLSARAPPDCYANTRAFSTEV